MSAAIENNRLDIIEYLLNNNKLDINKRLSGSGNVMRAMRPQIYLNAKEPANKDTILMRSVRCQNYKLTDLLLSRGANVNLTNNYNMTALHIAVQLGDIRLCKMLLKNNTTINQENIIHETPLLIAVKNGSNPIAELLRSHHARVPKKVGGKLLLEFIKKNDIWAAKILCESGADVSYAEESGYGSELPIVSPIILAVRNDQPDLVKYLLKKGATVSDDRYHECVHIYAASRNLLDLLPLLPYDPATTGRMLCYAAYYGHIDAIKFLLKQKHDINDFSNFDRGSVSSLQYLVDRCNPLSMAIAGRHYEAVKLLLDNGAQPETICGARSRFIKMDTFRSDDRVVISNPSMSSEVEPDCLNKRFDWIVKWIAGYCEPKIYELLAEYGRQPRGVDLFFAAIVENSALMDQLLRQGVKPPEYVEPWARYIFAVRPPNACRILSLLFDKSVLPINRKPSPSGIPSLLMDAITCKCEYSALTPPKARLEKKDIVAFLIKHGADVNFDSTDPNHGQCALYYAISQKQEDIIKILLEHNAKLTPRDADALLRQARGSLPQYKYLLSRGLKIAIDPTRDFMHMEICSAIEYEPYVIVKLIIENCENLNIVPKPDISGKKMTLLDYIEPLVKNKKIIELMRKKGAKKFSELKQ